jgi:glycosyltransferase involved in cell wall biosynthesis
VPRISVCIPTHNRADDLRQRFVELRAQTCSEFEIVVVDDDSRDETASVVAAARDADPRVRHVLVRPGLGIPGVVNHAIGQARGDYVALFHDHDRYDATVVEKLAAALDRQPRALFAFCGIRTIDPATRAVVSVSVEAPTFGRRNDVAAQFVEHGTSRVCASAVMLRKAALPAPPFRSDLGLFSDVGLWCELSVRGDAAYVDEPLVDVTGWSETDAIAKLHWRAVGDLAALRRRYLPLVRHGACTRAAGLVCIARGSARLKAMFLARAVRLALRTGTLPAQALAATPRPLRDALRLATLIGFARRRRRP